MQPLTELISQLWHQGRRRKPVKAEPTAQPIDIVQQLRWCGDSISNEAADTIVKLRQQQEKTFYFVHAAYGSCQEGSCNGGELTAHTNEVDAIARFEDAMPQVRSLGGTAAVIRGVIVRES
jgi:hypothetical protein